MKPLAALILLGWALLAYHLLRRHRELEVGDEPLDDYESWRFV